MRAGRAAALGALIAAMVAAIAGSPAIGGLAAAGPAAAGSNAPCTGDYVRATLRARPALRFGIDPELAGSAGSTQKTVLPVDPARTLSALRALRPPGRDLVLRINRLFEADGEAGIRRFARIIAGDTHAGFETELQVRYHPAPAQAGNIAAWLRYVRHVVDVVGPNRRLIAMTVTNEINLSSSPNTSDGAYPRAEDALVQGIIAAHREAVRRGFAQLRFGFTFAYRFTPTADAAVFTGLRRGGTAFQRALGFVGVDYYPELSPGRATPIPAATVTMMATMRRCFLPLGGLGTGVPLWITESGYDTSPQAVTPAQQNAALRQIVTTVYRGSATYGVTDYRWFNLRDNLSSTSAFAETSGLLTDHYARKPAFATYRSLIARWGTSRRP